MKHGVRSNYAKHGCRCDDCREAQRVYQNAWRWRKRRERDLAWNPDPDDGFWDQVDRVTQERLAA